MFVTRLYFHIVTNSHYTHYGSCSNNLYIILLAKIVLRHTFKMYCYFVKIYSRRHHLTSGLQVQKNSRWKIEVDNRSYLSLSVELVMFSIRCLTYLFRSISFCAVKDCTIVSLNSRLGPGCIEVMGIKNVIFVPEWIANVQNWWYSFY